MLSSLINRINFWIVIVQMFLHHSNFFFLYDLKNCVQISIYKKTTAIKTLNQYSDLLNKILYLNLINYVVFLRIHYSFNSVCVFFSLMDYFIAESNSILFIIYWIYCPLIAVKWTDSDEYNDVPINYVPYFFFRHELSVSLCVNLIFFYYVNFFLNILLNLFFFCVCFFS